MSQGSAVRRVAIGTLLLLIGTHTLVGAVSEAEHVRSPPLRAQVAALGPQYASESSSLADLAIDLLQGILDEIVAEAEEGEFQEATRLLGTLEALLGEVRALLVGAAGDVAREELAEIDEFLPRLREALATGDAEAAVAAADVIGRELEEIRAAAIGPAESADEALRQLEDLLAKIEEEVEEGEFQEALSFVERLEGAIRANRELLVDAVGEVAEEELAEISQFVERLEKALGNEDAAGAERVISLIREELREIREALPEPVGTTARVGSAVVAPGESAAVKLTVSGLERALGAYSFTLEFDPRVVQAQEVSVSYGTALPSPLVDNEAGKIRIQGVKPEQGQSGELLIAELTFRATAEAGSSTALHLSVDELSDTEGRAIRVGEVEEGRIDIEQ